MTRHKWHKQIKSWAETGEIDWRLNSGDDWQPLTFPAWHEDDGEYRINPEFVNLKIKNEDRIDTLTDAVKLYDTGLSSICGLITACLNEEELTPWQACSILRCILSTATYYAQTNDELLLETKND